jgi:hypothetical protein
MTATSVFLNLSFAELIGRDLICACLQILVNIALQAYIFHNWKTSYVTINDYFNF